MVDQSPTESGGVRATRMRLLHKTSPKFHVEETAVLRILSLPSPSIIAQELEFRGGRDRPKAVPRINLCGVMRRPSQISGMCVFITVTRRGASFFEEDCLTTANSMIMMMFITVSARDSKAQGKTKNMGVCTKERKGVTAEVLMATPCTNSLGGESRGHTHEGCVGRRLFWKFRSSPPFLGRERAARRC